MISVEEINKARTWLMFWLKRWYNNPLAYVIECLGEIPTHQQACILKAFAKHGFVSVATGHGIGKTRLEAWLTHWYLDTHGKRVPLTGASRDQLDDILWPEIVHVNNVKWKYLSSQYECLTDEIRHKVHKEGWKAVKRTAGPDNVDALQGFHDCMFGLEEASGIYEQVFIVAEGAFGDEANIAFMFGNPTKTSGYFFRAHNSKSHFWHCLHFSSADTLTDTEYKYSYVDPMGEIVWITTKGRQTRKWVDKMREEHGLVSNVYKIRVKGEFANMGLDFVMPDTYFNNLGNPHYAEDKDKLKIMGVDVGYTGDDATAVVIRQGRNILYAEAWYGLDTVESVNRIHVLQDEHRCDIINVDIIGVGAGVYDGLHHSKMPVRGVDVRNRCPDMGLSKTKCKMMRDWLWWQARQFYRTMNPRYGEMNSESVMRDLIRELGEPTYKIDPTGNVVIESKDDMKKRGLKSPNLADAHNMTFYGDTALYTFYNGVDQLKTVRQKKAKRRLNWKTC